MDVDVVLVNGPCVSIWSTTPVDYRLKSFRFVDVDDTLTGTGSS